MEMLGDFVLVYHLDFGYIDISRLENGHRNDWSSKMTWYFASFYDRNSSTHYHVKKRLVLEADSPEEAVMELLSGDSEGKIGEIYEWITNERSHTPGWINANFRKDGYPSRITRRLWRCEA